MVTELFVQYLSTAEHVILLIIAWAIAGIAFLQWKEKNQVIWIYVHLALLILPLVHFGTTIQCTMNVIPALMSLCGNYVTKISLLMLPLVIVTSILIGFFILPYLYVAQYRAKQVKIQVFEETKRAAGLQMPCLFVFESQTPKAFTVKKNVFASVGLFDILTKKEQQAVLLHELGHIRAGSNARKLSSLILSLFSPLAAFTPAHHQISKEEDAADAFAVELQKTTRFLTQAKRKIRVYTKLRQGFKK